MQPGVYALLVVAFCGGIVLTPTLMAQTPAAPTASAPEDKPLSPVEQRDQQVREFDPLDFQKSKQKTKSQDGTDSSDRSRTDRPAAEQTPLPGSIAAANQAAANQGAANQAPTSKQGPQVTEDNGETAPVQEYTGPAVLSRSYSINRPLIPEQVKWQESLGVSSVYDSGLAQPEVHTGGPAVSSGALYGTMLNWSFGGRHYFRRDLVSVNYTGNLSRYPGANSYNGANQTISVNYSHVLSRRLSLNLSGTGSLFSQNYALENQTAGPESIANVNLAGSPNLQIFDAGAKEFSSQVDVTWQKSARLSFSGGTSYFGIARDSAQLLGMTGQQVHGDVNYRITRKTTIGTYSSFSHYLYPHGFGNSHTTSFGVIYSYAVTRTLQIRFRGGISRVGSLGLQTVPINPALAVLLGQSEGVIDSSQAFRTTDYSAQVVKDFRGRATMSFAFARGISPGNGVFQTSQQQSFSTNFTTRIFRTYSLTVGAGRDTLASVAQALGSYQSSYGQFSFSRNYRRGIGVSVGMTFRHLSDAVNLGGLQNQFRITSGITWNPGTGRLWPF